MRVNRLNVERMKANVKRIQSRGDSPPKKRAKKAAQIKDFLLQFSNLAQK